MEKSDEELLEEWRLENEIDNTTVEDEFGATGLWYLYGTLSFFCRQFTKGPWEGYFTSAIVLAIILAGVLVGIDTYDELAGMPIFNLLENIVLGIFVFECVAKLVAEGKTPIKFFTGPEGSWNTFDFIVVIFCMPFFSDIFGNNSPAIRIVSRLFRLFRVAKIVHQIPALQVIVKGLVGGLKSIVYVATLLVLVFYLYGIIGVYMFKENDPFFFGDVPTALLTLFRVCTLENWGENMYINMYGCKDFDGGMYMVEEDMSVADWARLQDMYKCTNPTPQAGLSALFFISFTVVSSLVMLSLFIGVITMSMQESLNDMRREVEESNRRKRLLKAGEEMALVVAKNKAMEEARLAAETTKRMSMMMPANNIADTLKKREAADVLENDDSGEMDKDDLSGILNAPYRIRNWLMDTRCSVFFFGVRGRGQKLSKSERKSMKDMAEMKALMMQAWHGTKASLDYHHKMDADQEGSIEKYVRHFGVWSRSIIETPTFQNFITFVILVTAVVVGVETDYSNADNEWIFNIIEKVIFAIFASEVVLRILADDCVLSEYFSNAWNAFDFFVVALSNIPGGGTVIVMLRLVRLLRVLKLVKSLPQLQVIVNALLMGLSSIGYIGIIMILTFYLFAIMGIILFKENDTFNFGTLHQAIVALFKVATLDNWGDVLYINIYGCDVYPPLFSEPSRMWSCPDPKAQAGIAAAFFALFVVVGSLVMITLFVGVVTTSMEEATRLQMVELEIETRIMDLCHERSVTSSQLDIYRRVFSMLDLDGGGTIEGEELKSGLNAVNIKCDDEQLEIWVKEVDVNSDGVIDLIEFIIFMTNMKKKAVAEQERKLERKGADAFLRLRKKGVERRLAEGKDSKVVPANRPRSDSGEASGSGKGLMGSLRRTGSTFFRGSSGVDSPSGPASPATAVASPTAAPPSKPGFFKRASSAIFGDEKKLEVKGVFDDAKDPAPTTLKEQIFGRDTSNDVQQIYENAESGDEDEEELTALRRTGASFFKKGDEKK